MLLHIDCKFVCVSFVFFIMYCLALICSCGIETHLQRHGPPGVFGLQAAFFMPYKTIDDDRQAGQRGTYFSAATMFAHLNDE